MTEFQIRPLSKADREAWGQMAGKLWPEINAREHRERVDWMLADPKKRLAIGLFDNQSACGFAELTVREFANGCEQMPVPFLEGIWIAPHCRSGGFGRRLVLWLENWCLENGYSELGSDVELDNIGSQNAHKKWGFEETERVVYFRKSLKEALE